MKDLSQEAKYFIGKTKTKTYYDSVHLAQLQKSTPELVTLKFPQQKQK